MRRQWPTSTISTASIVRTLRDLTGNEQPFGGKVVLFGGDFRQVLPLMSHAERAKVVSMTIKRWNQWNNVRQLHRHQNMRARRACNSVEEADRFSTWLLCIGEGQGPTYDNGIVNDLIRMQEEMAVDSVDQLLN